MRKNILISGGGIAGLTAAKLLSTQGHQVTVIDRASSFAKAGFLISLKSFGVRIMEELGLTAELQAVSSIRVCKLFRKRRAGYSTYQL